MPSTASLAAVAVLSLALYSAMDHAMGQSFPIGPAIPSDFVAQWVYTYHATNVTVPMTGTLGSVADAMVSWRLDAHFPFLNRTEVFTQFENGTVVKGSYWVEGGGANGPRRASVTMSSVGAAPRNRRAAAVARRRSRPSASSESPISSGASDGAAAAADGAVFVCAPDVTQTGVRGFFLDWTSEQDVQLLGVEVVRGIKCVRWHLIAPSAHCLDLWTMGASCI